MQVYDGWSEEVSETVRISFRESGSRESRSQQRMSDLQESRVIMKDGPEDVRILYQMSRAMFEGVRDQGLVISEGGRLEPGNVITHAAFLHVASFCRYGMDAFLGKIADMLTRYQVGQLEGMESQHQGTVETTYAEAVRPTRLGKQVACIHQMQEQLDELHKWADGTDVFGDLIKMLIDKIEVLKDQI